MQLFHTHSSCRYSKQIIKMAKKTFSEKIGMTRKKKGGESENFDSLYDLSRCNSEDFEAVVGVQGVTESHHGRNPANGKSGVYESDGIFLMERHLVPVDIVQTGMSRFSFLLETSAPGTLPDPLLIGALLDLVSIIRIKHSIGQKFYRK